MEVFLRHNMLKKHTRMFASGIGQIFVLDLQRRYLRVKNNTCTGRYFYGVHKAWKFGSECIEDLHGMYGVWQCEERNAFVDG